MTLLEISTAAMSAYSGSLVIVCAIASAVILVFSFFHEKLKIFNTKHKFFTCSNTIVTALTLTQKKQRDKEIWRLRKSHCITN